MAGISSRSIEDVLERIGVRPDRWEARGRAEGEARGRAEGEAKGRAEGIRFIVRNALGKGRPAEEIADLLGLTAEEVEAIRDGAT
jgi:predicted transposase YdaD